MAPIITNLLEQRVALLLPLLEAKRYHEALQLLEGMHPSDLADLLELLDEEHRLALFSLLNVEDAAEVLDEISTEATRELVDAVHDEQIADMLEVMPEDDAAEILSEILPERSDALLALMEPEEAEDVRTLLSYPDQTAGRLMTTQIVRLHEAWTVQDTLEHLRHVDPEIETLMYLYVVNGRDRLVGVLSLRSLVTQPEKARVGDLMEPSVVYVRADADQEEAARMVSQYDYLALPVVDEQGVLLGIITHDDIVDILQEEFTEDIQRLGGSQPLDVEYLASPVFTIFRKRIGWLLILFMTATLTGTVMRFFEKELVAVVALSFFIPLMIGTGGNSGSQTTATIIRAIAMGEAQFKDGLRLVWHEMRIGLLLGLVMGIAGFIRSLMWHTGVDLALTVSLALLAVVLWANSVGALLPVIAARLKIDPAVISGPVMSTLVDATGLVIYFSLARFILRI